MFLYTRHANQCAVEAKSMTPTCLEHCRAVQDIQDTTAEETTWMLYTNFLRRKFIRFMLSVALDSTDPLLYRRENDEQISKM